jgi:hypothetical protein
MGWHHQVKQEDSQEEVMNSKNLKRGLVGIIIAMLCLSAWADAGGISLKCVYAPICDI